MAVNQQTLAETWQRYKEHHDGEARQALVLHYASLVKYVAGRIAIGLPPNVEMDDLVSNGILGLIDAVERFEPDRGIKFESYAIARIRGAIIDGLRSADWVPRSVRQKARMIEDTITRLESSLGRTATDEEISRALGVNLERYHDMLQEVSATTVTSLEDFAGTTPTGDRVRLAEMIAADEKDSPANLVDAQETKRLLAEAIDALPERERLVITLYYYEGLTLLEIGKVLGVTESRISQIHTKAILRLRGKMKIA